MARTKSQPQPKKRHRVTEAEFNQIKMLQGGGLKPVQVLPHVEVKRSTVQNIFNTATWEDWVNSPSRPIEKLTRADVERITPKKDQQEIQFIAGPEPVKPKKSSATDAAWANHGVLVRIEKLLQRLVSQNESVTTTNTAPQVIVHSPDQPRRRSILGIRKRG